MTDDRVRYETAEYQLSSGEHGMFTRFALEEPEIAYDTGRFAIEEFSVSQLYPFYSGSFKRGTRVCEASGDMFIDQGDETPLIYPFMYTLKLGPQGNVYSESVILEVDLATINRNAEWEAVASPSEISDGVPLDLLGSVYLRDLNSNRNANLYLRFYSNYQNNTKAVFLVDKDMKTLEVLDENAAKLMQEKYNFAINSFANALAKNGACRGFNDLYEALLYLEVDAKENGQINRIFGDKIVIEEEFVRPQLSDIAKELVCRLIAENPFVLARAASESPDIIRR